MRIFTYLFIFIFCISLASSIDVGTTSITGVDVSPTVTTVTFQNNTGGVNRSDYWDDLDSPNATQMADSGGVLTILESWFSTVFDTLFSAKTTDDLTEGTTNFYDNQTWNESHANNLYTYYSDEDWINKNNSLAFVFNETKLSTTYYNATQSQAVAGTIDGGTLGDTQHQDGAYDGKTFNFTEDAGSPGLDLRMNFTNISDFNGGVIRYKTTSTLHGDYPLIQVWECDDEIWEDYPSLAESESFATINQVVFDASEHVCADNVVRIRLYKSTNGNTGNSYYVDWIAIYKGYGTPAGEEVDPYSVHRDGNTTLTGDWNAGNYNITTGKWFEGLFNWTILGNWFSWTGSLLGFNETKLNETIDLRTTGFNSTYNATYDAYSTNVSINYTLRTYTNYNDAWTTTYNATYDSYKTNVSYGDIFVNESGDNMTGNLNMNYPNNITFGGNITFWYNGSDLIIE